MKRLSLVLLLSSVVAVLALSETAYAADSDDADTTVEVNDKDDGEVDDYDEDDEDVDDSSENGEGGEVVTGYSAEISSPQWNNGRCNKNVAVKGPGIDDVITVDCSVQSFVFANDTILVVGGAVFSNTPNTVVVVRGARCERRTYSQGGATPTTSNLSAQECAEVRRTMVQVQRESTTEQNDLALGLGGGVLGGGSNLMNQFRLGL